MNRAAWLHNRRIEKFENVLDGSERKGLSAQKQLR